MAFLVSCYSTTFQKYCPKMQMSASPESVGIEGMLMGLLAVECWYDDTSVLDKDYFIKTLSGIKATDVRPNLIGSIITNYASKCLPEISYGDVKRTSRTCNDSPESAMSRWMKKWFFVETLTGIPDEKDWVSCNFLLRLLRTGKIVGLEPTFLTELEKRISWQLDRASLKEIMIPSFSRTCATMLGVELVYRMVQNYSKDVASKSGSALGKVAKLVDSYLAEVAIDTNLKLPEFLALAGALPSHARSTDDWLYRAIDTYMMDHQDLSKKNRKRLCKLIDIRKLSSDASFHAAQNERLPVRIVIQVLFSEHARINSQIEWSKSYCGIGTQFSDSVLNHSVHCLCKREKSAQNMEVNRLSDEVQRLHYQFNTMQAQMEKLLRKNEKGSFRWMKSRVPSFRPINLMGRVCRNLGVVEVGDAHQSQGNNRGKLV